MLSDLLPVIVAVIAICFMGLQIKTNILPVSEGNDRMRTRSGRAVIKARRRKGRKRLSA